MARKEFALRNAQQRRISLREQGKRRVSRLTQAAAAVGGALAALFGVVFAENASAVTPSTAPPPVTESTQPTSPPSTMVAPSTPETGGDSSTQTTAPIPSTVQPPAELPQPVFGGSGHVRSRSTP